MTSKTHHSLLIVLSVTFMLYLALHNVSAGESKKTVIKRYSAVISKPSGFMMPDELKKLQFKFSNSEISAWVRENGEWHIEGLISHENFLCADYSLGIRFGEGSPGCIDVKWLTEDQYATKKKQCNNVDMNHSGYQTNDKIVPVFNKITCAQSIIKCVGACN